MSNSNTKDKSTVNDIIDSFNETIKTHENAIKELEKIKESVNTHRICIKEIKKQIHNIERHAAGKAMNGEQVTWPVRILTRIFSFSLGIGFFYILKSCEEWRKRPCQ
jgi:hypothetical protein